MESESVSYEEEIKSSQYNFDFKNASIRINYFQNYFVYVDFKEKIRWKITLSQFKFISEGQDKYWKQQYGIDPGTEEKGVIGIEPFESKYFVPLDEFKDTDQIIHIAPHYVYLLRGHISTTTKLNTMMYSRGGSFPKVYKFDFKNFEYQIVYTFTHDVYGSTITRYKINPKNYIELISPYSKVEIKAEGYWGFLILGGRGIKCPKESEHGFLKQYYFYVTHNYKGDPVDLMYIVKGKGYYVKTDPVSITHRINNLDYVIWNAGSKKKEGDDSKELIHTGTFETLYYHIDKESFLFGVPKDDGFIVWNSIKYAMIPTGKFIYLFGGRSLVEADDLSNEKLNIRKLEISMFEDEDEDEEEQKDIGILNVPLDIKSITETPDFNPKRISKALLFNEESHSDLCYLNYVDELNPPEKLYGLFTTYSDPHEIFVLEYDTVKEKPIVQNLRVEYRPVKHKTKLVKYII